MHTSNTGIRGAPPPQKMMHSLCSSSIQDVFKNLQVVTASAVAFVHGANDVGNGVGPLAGIW